MWGKPSAVPTSSGVENTSTSRSENRGSHPCASPAPGSRPAPNSASSPAICPATHSPTFGKSAKGRVSSADVLADVTQGTPSRRATSGPARACWSATTTSGPKVRTARSTPGTIARASGTSASSHRNRSAPTPRRFRQRSWSSLYAPPASSPAGRIRACAGSSRVSVPEGPVQAISWPRAASSAPTATVGLTCPASGGTVNSTLTGPELPPAAGPPSPPRRGAVGRSGPSPRCGRARLPGGPRCSP